MLPTTYKIASVVCCKGVSAHITFITLIHVWYSMAIQPNADMYSLKLLLETMMKSVLCGSTMNLICRRFASKSDGQWSQN